MQDRNHDITKRCDALFARQKMEMTRDVFAPNTWAELEGLPAGGSHKAVEDIVADVFGAAEQTFGKGFRIHPGSWYGNGDSVILEGRFSGSLNGTEYELPFSHVMKVEEGRLTDFRRYTNTW